MLAAFECVPLDGDEIRLACNQPIESCAVGNRVAFRIRRIVRVQVAGLPRRRACRVAVVVLIGALLKTWLLGSAIWLRLTEQLISHESHGEKQCNGDQDETRDSPEAP